MTDVSDWPLPPAARAFRTSGSVKPPSANAPACRNSRRRSGPRQAFRITLIPSRVNTSKFVDYGIFTKDVLLRILEVHLIALLTVLDRTEHVRTCRSPSEMAAEADHFLAIDTPELWWLRGSRFAEIDFMTPTNKKRCDLGTFRQPCA